MAIHSSILAWRISWTETAGGLQSVGSQRAGHDWATNTHITHSDWCEVISHCSFYLQGQEEKGATEGEMAEWHHWFNGHELGRTLGDGEGQGSLECCSPWGRKELDMTWWLNSKYNKSYSVSYSWTTITMQMNLVWQNISMICKKQAIQLSSYFLKLWSWLKGRWSMLFLLTPYWLVFSFHQ